MLDQFLQYYGLDWAALTFGVIGSYLIGNMRREGFVCGMIACCCGFTVAYLSQQYGFVVYNVILISLATRNYLRWGRRMKQNSVSYVAAE